eukprot:SAG11_NODE_1881_length_4130_cov_2.080873_1_plen_103_part_00
MPWNIVETLEVLPCGAHSCSRSFTNVKYRVLFEPASRHGIGGEHDLGGGGGGGGGTIKPDQVSLPLIHRSCAKSALATYITYTYEHESITAAYLAQQLTSRP